MSTLLRWAKILGLVALVFVGLVWTLKLVLIPRDVARKLRDLPPVAKHVGELCYAEGTGPWFNTLVEKHGPKVIGDALLALLAVPDQKITSCAALYVVEIKEFRAIPILEAATENSGTQIPGAKSQLKELHKLKNSMGAGAAR